MPKVHFMGIGGSGMSGAALLAREAGLSSLMEMTKISFFQIWARLQGIKMILSPSLP